VALVLYVALVVLFASWSTLHVWLCAQLFRVHRRKAVVSFVVFPLAPYFGFDLRLRKLSSMWLTSAVLYLVVLLLVVILGRL
jgi:hypothetical protein